MPASAFAAALSLALIATATGGQTETLLVLDDWRTPQLLFLDPETLQPRNSIALSGHEALFGGIAADNEDVVYSIDGYQDQFFDRTATINPLTGQVTIVGPTLDDWNFRTISVDPTTNILYAATDNYPGSGGQLWTLDKQTGAATFITKIAGPGLDQLTALGIGPDGTAYITDYFGADLFTIDLHTGDATKLGTLGQPGNWFDDLAVNAAGELFGSRTGGGFYRIRLDTMKEELLAPGFWRSFEFIGGDCYADFNADAAADLFDFLAYANAFIAGEFRADCDGSGSLDLFDFLCFTNSFNGAC